jgi:hypothetical protein
MDYEPVETPNPREFAVLVWASPTQVFSKMVGLVPGTSTLASCNLAIVPESEGFGNYLYLKPSGKRQDGYMGFLFGATKTEAQKYTPYDTVSHSKDYYWPNVMERWKATPEITRALQQFDPNGKTVYSMRWKAHFRMKPYVQGNTQFERLLYLAPTKFELQKPVIMQPVSFGWDLPGDGMEPTRMLIAQRIRRPNRVLQSVALSTTTFEPTYPNGWARHLADTDQEQLASGLWHMWEDYALPPNQVNTIRDK